MKILIEQGEFEILSYTPDAEKLIERCGRIAHRSEGKITEDSYKKFIEKFAIKMHHESILEHASVTVLFKNHSRGFSHELVRHRLCAFTQESTRYVKQNDLHFVAPPGMQMDQRVVLPSGVITTPANHVQMMQGFYGALLELGWKPQDARQFLPIGVTSEIVVTTNFREWRHIFKLRCDKAAHWEIRRTMLNLLEEFIKMWPTCFKDLSYLLGSSNERSINLVLTESEWCELANAVSSKAILVERGDYGEEDPEEGFDPKRWEEELNNIYEKVEYALKKAGIAY